MAMSRRAVAITGVLMVSGSLIPVEGAAQQQELDSCILKTYRSGDKVNLIGSMSVNPHNLLITVSGCSSAVLVEYPSTLNTSEQGALSPLEEDNNLKEMNTLLSDRSNKHITANLFGRLDIAPTIPEGTKNVLGFLVDGSGKRVGRYEGFGHPLPTYAYRLVLQSVSSINASQR